MNRSTQSLIAEYEQNFDERPSSLGRFLSLHGPLDRSQIQTLILWQQSQSWRSGQGTFTEEYLCRYPELFSDHELVLDLIYSEYLLRRKLDPTIAIEQFSHRFPGYADQLRQQVEFHESIGADLIDDWLVDDNDANRSTFNSAHSTGDQSSLLHDGADNSRFPNKRVPQLAIPGYRILGELGRGGMAVVYLAEDERLHRRVALKMLLAGTLASETLLRRMEVEGEAIARLQHPHIVQIFEVGQHEDRSYLALEYANSGTLAQWMRHQPQSPLSAAKIVQQLATTVQFAHSKGILHRDLKPSNVLLHDLSAANATEEMAILGQISQQDDISHLQLKIADFGLAKFINGDSHDGQPVEATMTGDLLGTAAYMSPEQAKGSSSHLTAATDIYSLGAVLYELLTGRPPFVGVEPLAMLNQVMLDDPVRPSELVPLVPRDLETICLKCLQKNPDRRYTTANELAEEIDRYLSNQPILARRSSLVERSWRWCRRHPAKASSILFLLTLFMLMIGGLVAYSEIMREQLEDISIANRRERLLRTEALDRLLESHLSGAKALLTSQQVGQRFASLDALDQAHRLNTSIELTDAQRQRIRNGVLAALTLPDFQYPSAQTIHCDPSVHAIAMDAQQRVLALPISETQVSLFDYKTAASLVTVDTKQEITSLALNQDASLLAAGGQKLRIYDLSNPAPTCKLEIEPHICTFSTVNSRELITVNRAAVVERLNIDTSESKVLYRGAGRPRQVSMSPDGRFMAIWTISRVEVFETATGQVRLRFQPPIASGDNALSWNSSSTTLAIGPYHHGIELWDVPHRTKLFTVPQSELSTKFCFDTIGSRLLTYSQWGSYVSLWNLTNSRCEFTQKNMRISYAVANASGFQLWQPRGDNELSMATIVTPSLFRELPSIGRASAISSNVFVAYNQDGTIIALAKEGTLELFDATSLQLLARIVTGSSYFQFDPLDNLVTLDTNGMVRWPKKVASSTATGQAQTIEFGPPEKLFDAPAFAPFEMSRDGKWLGFSDGEHVHLWSVLNNQTHVSLPHTDARRLSFCADNELCATGGWNTGNVNIWSTASGERVKQIDVPSPCIVRFSSDGKWLAIGSKDISVWSTRDWKLAWRCEVMGHASSGMSLCFSPDSQQLAVSDALGKIHLFEVLNGGQQYAEITSPPQEQILDMVFSPQGKQLAILTFRGACVWDLNSLRRELLSRNLDWDDRIQKYFGWPTGEDEYQCATAPSIAFNMNEDARHSEAFEQATRVAAAIARFDYQSAQAAIDRAIELRLNDPTACNDLAWLLVTGPMELRAPEKALELIERAINSPSVPADKRALYLNTFGVVQYRAGRLKDAFDTLMKSVATQSPKDQPYDLYFLSMCAARQNDSSVAKEFFTRAEALRIKFSTSTSLLWNRELEEFSREARELLE